MLHRRYSNPTGGGVHALIGNTWKVELPPCRAFRLWPGIATDVAMLVISGCDAPLDELLVVAGQLVVLPPALANRPLKVTLYDPRMPYTYGGYSGASGKRTAAFVFAEAPDLSDDWIPGNVELDAWPTSAPSSCILLDGDMSADVESDLLYVGDTDGHGFAIDIYSANGPAATRAGSLKLEANGQPLNSRTWHDVPSFTAAVVATVEVNEHWEVAAVTSGYVRVVFTDSTGGAGAGALDVWGIKLRGRF